MPWLKSQIRSLISNACDYHKRRPESRYPASTDPEFVEDKLSIQTIEDDSLGNSITTSTEATVIAHEEEKQAEEFIDVLYQNIQGEPELEEILDALLDGCEPKPRFLADELGISTQEVRNRINRLRRKALKLQEDR